MYLEIILCFTYSPFYRYVPVPQPQMYVSASPQGGNIMPLANNVQYIPQAGHPSPGQIVQGLPGGPLLFQPQPYGFYAATTPIKPVHNPLPAQCEFTFQNI
jgi:hypothetical protein